MIVPRWEWRTFGDDFGAADRWFAANTPERVQESDETYLLSLESDASVKVRDRLMDVKLLEAVDADGLEQWKPVMKVELPLAADGVREVFDALAVPAAPLVRDEYTVEQLVGELVDPDSRLRSVEVHKHRERFTVGGAMAELSEIQAAEGARADDRDRVGGHIPRGRGGTGAGPAPRPNVCMARGLKALVGFGA